jgi:hypothetical protein
VLIRDRSAAGHDLAAVTTDTTATAAEVIERYASRWSIEGRDRRRQSGSSVQGTPATEPRGPSSAPSRSSSPARPSLSAGTLPSATTRRRHGHRFRAPYTSQAQPSNRSQIPGILPPPAEPEEINAIRLAWDEIAA